MSNESSATKWIVGCLAAGLLCLVACGGLIFWMVTTTMDAGRQMADAVAQQAQVMQQASNWNFPGGWTAPAEDAADDAVLPLQVAEWERMFLSPETAIPVIDVNRDTLSAVYAAEGHSLDVYVSRVSADEQEAVFEQAKAAISSDPSGHSTIGSDDGTTRTLHFQTWGESGIGWIVWNGGWLFVINATDSTAPIGEFMTAYFEQIDARPPAETADPVPADTAAEGAIDPDPAAAAEPAESADDASIPDQAPAP